LLRTLDVDVPKMKVIENVVMKAVKGILVMKFLKIHRLRYAFLFS